MNLRWYQSEAVLRTWDYLCDQAGNPVIVLPTGCHQAGHLILLANGDVVPVEDVRVGDKVMGPDGTPRNVLALCRGVGQMYVIAPVKGERFVVNEDHVLHLEATNEGKAYRCNTRHGDTIDVPVKEYVTWSKSKKHLWKLKWCSGIEFPYEKNKGLLFDVGYEIPPYIVGLMLGDGHMNVSIDLTTADEECAREWTQWVESKGWTIFKETKPNNAASSYRLVSGTRGGYCPAKKLFARVGLLGHVGAAKYIPRRYGIAPRSVRLEVLAGLLDSDGHHDGRGGFAFSNKSEKLCLGVAYIARSLGMKAVVRIARKKSQSSEKRIYWNVSISGDTSCIPCRLKRKQAPARKQKKDWLKSGFKIEKAWVDNYYGFTLDKDHLYLDGEFLIHHNSGKSLVVAKLAQDAIGFGSQVLILAHRKELLEQNADKVRKLLPGVKVGLFSAGLRSWDAESPVVLAGIQSCWQKASIFGPRHLVLIDEAHLVSTNGEGMYRSFLNDLQVANPTARLVGLTATPYRTGEGSLTGPEKLFQGVSYEAKIPQLIREGFLSPITSRAAEHSADTSSLHVRGGEFIAGEVEQLFGNQALVKSAIAETVEKTRERRSVILFCAGIEHAESVAEEIRNLTREQVGVVTGASLPLQRANDLRAFRDGSLRWLVNVDVLTTGFDAPNIDAIAVLRATCSPGLFAQICGRGFRLAPGKADCLVLDFGENIKRHGPLDADDYGMRSQPKKGDKGGDAEGPQKACPNCQQILHAAARECACGFLFPPPAPRHGAEAGSEELLAAMAPPQKWVVDEASMKLWTNKKTGSRTLRVDYHCQLEGASGNLTREVISEWVCLEHDGYAGLKAAKWWSERCSIPVNSIEEALAAWQRGAVGFPQTITTKREGRFPRVTAYTGIVIPDAEEWLDEPDDGGSVFGEEDAGAWDEVPF